MTTQPNAYSNAAAHRVARLNHGCLQALIQWLNAHLDLAQPPRIWPGAAALPSLWEMVTGTAITLGNQRLVLIPSDALDTEEFCVPQEWVDIPQWAADYYLGIQVDVEQGELHCWGYTSHRTLKTQSHYDPIYHTYALEHKAMIPDLDLLWVAQDLDLKEKAPLPPLPQLTSIEADHFLTQLSQPSPYSPRLDLAFTHWAALLANDDWRQQLYQARLQHRAGVTSGDVAIPPMAHAPLPTLRDTVINTAVWLQDQLDQVAQNLSWVLLPAFAPEPVGLRSQTPELDAILAQLQHKSVAIPRTARSAYHNLQVGANQLRLYAVTWPRISTEAIPEWFLLLILLGQPNHRLTPGTKLRIRDATGILIERELHTRSIHQYIYGGVSGTWSETFGVTITLADGASLTLPEFAFNPAI